MKEQFSVKLYSLKAAIIFDAAIEFEIKWKNYIGLPAEVTSTNIYAINPFTRAWSDLKNNEYSPFSIKSFNEPFKNIYIDNDGSIELVLSYEGRGHFSNKKAANLIERLQHAIFGIKRIYPAKSTVWYDNLNKLTEFFGISPVTTEEIELTRQLTIYPNLTKENQIAQRLFGKPFNPFISEVMLDLNTQIQNSYDKLFEVHRNVIWFNKNLSNEEVKKIDDLYKSLNDALNQRNEFLKTRENELAA